MNRLAVIFATGLLAVPGQAVIFQSTGDPTFNTTAPGGVLLDSGWQLQGEWLGFLGTPIAPNFFLTAKHVGGGIGQTFTFQGTPYVTYAVFNDPASDLALWRVTTPFPTYAPLYVGSGELGQDLVVFGRGTQRGAALGSSGWAWGAGDGVMRWGTNTVSAIVSGGAGAGPLLAAEFNLGASVNEAHLSIGDSGGAVFIKDTDSIWKLAGINYAVDGPYSTTPSPGGLNAALHDQSGYFVESSPGVWTPATGPGRFYATRVSSNLGFISSVAGVPEPTTAALLAFGALAFVGRRRR
jgi:hypothetical protein